MGLVVKINQVPNKYYMSIMPRNFQTQRGCVKPDVMLHAVRLVRYDNKSVQGTARDFGINYQTLLFSSILQQCIIIEPGPWPSREIGY